MGYVVENGFGKICGRNYKNQKNIVDPIYFGVLENF